MVVILVFPLAAHALEVPPLTGYVNDYAGMISPAAKATLESEMRAFEQASSTQIVILTIPSLQGEVIEEFSIRVADAWKIGQKGKDNGIIFTVAKEDRKIRIEVGRGLEGPLTDLLAGRIIDLVVKPKFKRGEFDEGFIAGVHALIDATRGEFSAERKGRGPSGGAESLGSLLVFFGIFLAFLGKIWRFLPVVGGAVGAPLLARFGLGFTGLVPAVIGAVLGAVIGLFFSGFSAPHRKGMRSTLGGGPFMGGGFPSTFGGGGSFGGSGGGFSGGGGGFGGGGASGDW